ncbi:MAG TPA: DUF4124 domain-containing protein [Thermodesulfobacteriota bacterium]|nr:DUF4124 domain-containing protein [Thermodesulfobacteriota bacterium]
MRTAMILFFMISLCSTGWAETYRWVDEKGTVNFTQDYGSIPGKYRDQVKKKPDKSDDLVSKTNETSQKKIKGDSAKALKESPRKDRHEVQKINKRTIESEAAEGLKTILSLWKDEKYETLYEYGTDKNKVAIAKEDFVRKMKKKNWGLASSWETVQDIETKFKKPALVYVTAKVGHKPKQGGKTKILTETYPMTLEDGVWKTDLSKILRAP